MTLVVKAKVNAFSSFTDVTVLVKGGVNEDSQGFGIISENGML